LDRTVAVAGLQVDGAHRILADGRIKTEAGGVQSSFLHAVVGRQADHYDSLDAALPQEIVELGAALLAALGVAQREPGVAVFPPAALPDGGAVDVQLGMEPCAPCLRDAVDRPDASVLLKVGSGLWMPVLGVDDDGSGGACPLRLFVYERNDVLAA
jgi:hypothetical protein